MTGRCLVGVLGGMGPAATADFFAKLVRATPAATDQEHLATLVWSDPSIPDRTDALLGTGPSPVPRLVEGVHLLDRAGATLIAIPCSTAHAFLPELRRATARPVVSMVEATVQRLRAAHPQVTTVGLLATTGTVTTGLYQRSFRWSGIDCLVPAPPQQERVMQAVRQVKAGNMQTASRTLGPPVAALTGSGAQILVAACTELPLVLGSRAAGCDVFDPTKALAEDVVVLARRQQQNNLDKESTWTSASA
ncbi:amino acid racemase [Actinoplanes sp. NPDC049548]|uniref:aspartate/glutamate racemase family protein n=1 Tax=Actinoplanes sp. NPDC049548 TaxID=3155152 RepID=UPI0034175BF1